MQEALCIYMGCTKLHLLSFPSSVLILLPHIIIESEGTKLLGHSKECHIHPQY
jgi:hypothetical protein